MKYTLLVLLVVTTYSYSTDGDDIINRIDTNSTPAQIDAWLEAEFHCDEDLITHVDTSCWT